MSKTADKDKKKWAHLKDLAGHCRVLSLLTILFFGLTSFILIIVCAACLGPDSFKFNMLPGDELSDEEKHQTNNAIMLITLTVLAITATAISVLFLLATLTDNMWLTIPYWLLLLILMAVCLYQLLHFGLCIGRCDDPPSFEDSGFTRNILNGAGVDIFVSMTFFGFLLYVFMPSFGYFLECRAKRAERNKNARKSIPKGIGLLPMLAPHPILEPLESSLPEPGVPLVPGPEAEMATAPVSGAS